MSEPELKQESLATKSSQRFPASSLARAFDHCPSVLFAFLTDREAGRVASALCQPRFLPNMRYEIKDARPLDRVLAGRYPCVVRKVKYNYLTARAAQMGSRDADHDDWILPSSLLSTVTWLSMMELPWDEAWQSTLRGVLQSMPLLRSLEVNVPVSSDDLPRSLTELILRDSSHFSTKGVLVPPFRSPSLRKLVLPTAYPLPIRSANLPNLRELQVGDYYFQDLDDLPPLLTELTMPGKAVALNGLDHLPASLTVLRVSRFFREPLDKLPSSLRVLAGPRGFNHPLSNLPSSLTELLFGNADEFNQPLDHLLPQQLQVLSLGRDFKHPLNHLPSSLTRLDLSKANSFDQPLDRLPASLEVLSLGFHFNRSLDHLPSSLKELDLSHSSSFNQPLHHLPDSLHTLKLGYGFNQPFARLPRALTTLHLLGAFNHPLPLVAPLEQPEQSVQGDSESPSDHACYPSALRSLYLGPRFNQPLTLPRSLTTLDIASGFFVQQPLPVSSLPEGLTALRLPVGYAERFPEYQDEAVRRQCPNMISARYS